MLRVFPYIFFLLASASVCAAQGFPSVGDTVIAELKDGSLLPEELFSKLAINRMADDLVSRKHLSESLSTAKKQFNYEQNSYIQIMFWSKFLRSIVTEGFKNSHQTRHSEGTYLDRSLLEDELIGIQLGNDRYSPYIDEVYRLRPKYGYVSFTRDLDGLHHSEYTTAYGNIVATLKREVLNRSTFTVGDSLRNYDYRGTHVAYTFGASDVKAKDIKNDEYWEAQVWGDLTIQDVAYFLINCPSYKAQQKIPPMVSQDDLSILKDLNIPVYQCRVARDHSHLGMGTRIY